ncbi:MAG: GAF domain-containing sensor histidine kinase [Nocardioides sp.]
MRTREDELREQALEAYDVLGGPPRRELEALVELAAKFTGVPMATINLFTATQQWQVATYGFEAAVCDREDSMCRYVLAAAQPIVLADASLDNRFRDNPLITGELARVRFYASHPLVTPDGVVLGTLCVFDERPHEVDPETEQTLETLSARVIDVLQLELTSRRLATANERLGAFAGQVSHDLRNPLSAVRMSLELMREEMGDGSDAGLLNLLERAERGIRRMDDMISELLTFARVGAAIEPADVDLTRVVHDVVEGLAGAATADQIVVDDLPTVWGDAVQLQGLLQNLLANAVKFSPPGTPVTVTAVALDRGWRISVADRGPGVPPEDRERVFDPLVRLDTRVPGSGIGLATCRRIVEAHGGRIGVAENPDSGAVVWFELPA